MHTFHHATNIVCAYVRLMEICSKWREHTLIFCVILYITHTHMVNMAWQCVYPEKIIYLYLMATLAEPSLTKPTNNIVHTKCENYIKLYSKHYSLSLSNEEFVFQVICVFIKSTELRNVPWNWIFNIGSCWSQYHCFSVSVAHISF